MAKKRPRNWPGWASADPYQAMDGADSLVILTEWPEFGSLDLARVRGLLQRPLIVDGRNMYSHRDYAQGRVRLLELRA
jgi:UDP-glucose 6-dehydrogenase